MVGVDTVQLFFFRTKDLKEEVKRVAFKEILIQYNRKYFHVTQPREAAVRTWRMFELDFLK